MVEKTFQKFISKTGEKTNQVIGITDETGKVINSSSKSLQGRTFEFIPFELSSGTDIFVRDGYMFKTFVIDEESVYTVFVEGEDALAENSAVILSVMLTDIGDLHNEKNNRINFIKNVSTDNIMPGDLSSKARELHLSIDAKRVVMIVRQLKPSEVPVLDVLQNIFPTRNKDFAFTLNDTDTVVVKELAYEEIDYEVVIDLANVVADTIKAELMVNCQVGVGSIVTGIKDISRSFKEANSSLSVGRIFDAGKNIICYNRLGIARLISCLPKPICDTFLLEIFPRDTLDALDTETMNTIAKFFENNLNVSETSRRLFVHRNTLVYRLEKIRKCTGLDLREFDQAIVFKIALMVKKFMQQ